MATTHALVGAVLAAVTLFVAPELSTVAVVAGLAGGVFPDLDLYAGHRKTLHFPVYYPALAVPALALVALAPSPATAALGFFLLAAAVHSVMDVFGGGLELRPWLGTSDRAVYNHVLGRWHRPRRWVPYDGSPRDLALASAVAVPALAAYDGAVAWALLAVLLVSAGYTLVRRRLVDVAEWLLERVPGPVLAYVPGRFLEDVAP